MLLFFDQKDLHQEPLQQFAVAFQVKSLVDYPDWIVYRCLLYILLAPPLNDCLSSEYRITELILYKTKQFLLSFRNVVWPLGGIRMFICFR